MTMCTVKEIQEAIREDCKSQHDMDSTDIDRVMQTLPFAQEEPFTEARPQKPLFLILSILVDTFSSRISLTMPPSPKPHNTACVLS